VYPSGWIERYVEQAAARGATEIGFTEHLYRCVEAAPVLGRFWEREPRIDLAQQAEQMVAADLTLSLEDYLAVVISAKDRGLPVKLGLEVDFFPETIEAVVDFLSPYPFDFLIGSVHWVGGWSIDSSRVTYEFERRGIERAWEDYFLLVAQLATSGAVDVLAHVDVCKKFGYRPPQEPAALYREVVAAAVASGTAVEVSSQGLRWPAREVYPSPGFLSMFEESGVGITLASDAHHPDDAAFAHEQVTGAARAAGYTHHLRFADRQSHPVPLTDRMAARA
jgi:histidinol-phosphatase (PHP family)